MACSSVAAAPHLRTAGGGAIVHVASTLGVRSAPGTTAYAATKAALLSVTRTLALELAADKVRVNAVLPGVVDTDMVRVPRVEVAPEEAPALIEKQLAELRELHPIGRLGEPEDVAAAVCYLLDASWVTGAALEVDGGLLAG